MKNPIYAFIAFLVVEMLVGAGYINRTDAEAAQYQIENVVFYIVLAGTGLLGFRQYISAHKHQVTKEAEIASANTTTTETITTVKTNTDNTPVFTDSGTPPVVE